MTRRILFISERYPPDLGGVATSAARISRALAALGFEVDVVTWTRTLQAGMVADEPGNPRVLRMGRFREWDSTMIHTTNLFDWLSRDRPYAAIWGHYLTPAGFLAVWRGRLTDTPSTVSVRGNDIDRDMFPPGDFSRLRWTLENADCVSTVTQELARKVAALTGRVDVVCLKNVTDTECFRPISQGPELAALREHIGIRPDEAVLGFAGELREKKGQQFLLDALRRVREVRPACLLIIGEVRASEAARLSQWSGSESLAEQRVLVTGQLDSPAGVNRHLNLCDVYLQPSLWDGMPNALLEAMAAGCFCIASDAGGIPEVLVPEAGVLVPRWELQKLGGLILDWLSRPPEQRTALGRAARDHVVQRFDARREPEMLQAVMDRLIPSSS